MLCKSRELESCQLLLFYLLLLVLVASGLQAGDRMRGEMTFQRWRPRLPAFLLQIRARAVTVLGLSTIPTGIAGGGDIPGLSLSSLWLVWDVGSSAIVWVGFQQGRVKGMDAQSVKSPSQEKTPKRAQKGGGLRKCVSRESLPKVGSAGPRTLRQGWLFKNRGLGGQLFLNQLSRSHLLHLPTE